MDLGTIFGLIILVICILVVVLINHNKKKKKNQFKQTLLDLAEKNNCNISESDLWNNTLIGIDKEAHQLFFIRESAAKKDNKEISLLEIQKCRVINSSRMVTNGGSTHNVIDKLELVLNSRDPKQTDVTLEFYNTNRDNLFLNGELPLAEKWAGIVNENIAGIAQKK